MKKDCLILGSGPEALAAAAHLARVKRQCALLASEVLPSGNLPPWLQHLREEAQAVPFLEEEVVQAALGASEKKITTRSEKSYEVSALILAGGGVTRTRLIEGEEKFAGRGVFYNAFQDGCRLEGKTLVVEGKNEQAIQETIYLARFAGKICFVVPAMRLEGEARLTEALQNNPKIEVLTSASLKRLEGEDQLRQAVILSGGEEKAVPADGVFLYARRSHPHYEYLKGTVEISPEGCVLVDETFMTSIPGVFACGDMIAGVPQLPFVSAAQGMIAALHADRYLSNLEIGG